MSGRQDMTVAAEDASAYRQMAQETNYRNGRILFVSVTLLNFVYWPFDRVLVGQVPEIYARYQLYRPWLAVMGVFSSALFWVVPPVRRHAMAVLTTNGLLATVVLGWCYSQGGSPSTPWFHLLHLLPLGTVGVSLPLGKRVCLNVAVAAAVIGGYFLPHPAYWHDPLTPMSLSYFGFAVILSTGAGEYRERLHVSQFLLSRQIERQAAELQELNGALESRVQEQTAELQQLTDELRVLTAYNESTREDERTRIARELHDELGQELTALKFVLSATQQRYQRDPGGIARGLRELSEHLQRTTVTTRNIVVDLRPRVLDDLGLAAAAEWLVTRTEERAGVKGSLRVAKDLDALPDHIATAAFRILQESLTNVARHSMARHVEVEIRCEPALLRLQVADDGIGVEESRRQGHKSGMGLVGMRERTHALGGEFRVGPRTQGGTVVEATLPLTKETV